MDRKNLLLGIWLIGLGILFLVGHVWPGILILIGISMIVSAYMKDESVVTPTGAPATPEPAAAAEKNSASDAAEEGVVETAVEPLPDILAPEAEKLYLASRLPEKCPACDAPMKTMAEKMSIHDDQTTACLFCGYRLKV